MKLGRLRYFLYTAVLENLFDCRSEHSEAGVPIVLPGSIYSTSFNYIPVPTTWLQACCNFSVSLLSSCSVQSCHCSSTELPWWLSWSGCRHIAGEAERVRGSYRLQHQPSLYSHHSHCLLLLGPFFTFPPLTLSTKESHMLKRRKLTLMVGLSASYGKIQGGI